MNRKYICYVLSFILALGLFAFGTGMGITMGFFDEGSLHMAFNESDSFNDFREEIIRDIKANPLPEHIDILTIEHIISKDMVWKDMTAYVNAMYRNTGFNVDEESFGNSYYGGVQGMLTEKNILITKDIEKELDDFLPVLYNFYNNKIKEDFRPDGFVALKNSYKTSVRNAVIAGAILSVLCSAGIWFIVKDKKEKLKFYSYAFLSGGIISMVVPSILLICKGFESWYAGIELMNKATYAFLRNGLITVNVCGAFLVFVGVGLAITELLSETKEKTE